MNTPLLITKIDKANHFIVGYLIYSIFFLIIGYWALVPVFIAAAGKEVFDSYTRKLPFDWYDFLYTIAGCIPNFITTII